MYNIDFVHRKGALHQVPDALSRAWEGTYEVTAVASSTTEDPWYQEKIKNVERNPSRYPDWKVMHGLLYAHRPNKNLDPFLPDMDAWKLVLPAGDRAKVLTEAHDTPQSGHLGIEKTFARVAMFYFWPGYYRDVCSYVAQCQECQAHKGSQQAPAGLMTERNIEGPWIVVAADIMGPKPPSRSGNKYVIVFEDLFSRYVELKPLRKADAKSVLKAFDELIINRWGCPRVLLTDNGIEFANKMVSHRMIEYGVVQSTIPP